MSKKDDAMPAESTADLRLDRGLKRSAILLFLGLGAEALSLIGLNTPVGFMAFAAFGGSLIAAGMLSFLWAIGRREPTETLEEGLPH